MLVSHRHRFIYIKTMKTASSSVELAFEGYCLEPGQEHVPAPRIGKVLASRESEYGVVGARGEGAQAHRWWHHMPARQIKAQLPPEVWDGYYKFCCVRNPWDKVVSAFHFTNRDMAKLEGSERLAAFREWLFGSPRLGRDFSTYTIAGKTVVNRYIRYETLADDMVTVCNEIGVPPPALASDKAGLRPAGTHYSAYFDDESRDHVAKIFAADIALLGYDFEDRRAA